MYRAPSLFVSHGSPMFALEPGRLGPNLARVGAAPAGLRAIVNVSPHGHPRGVRVTSGAKPETVHDFGGFPAPLYELQYPAPGDATLAARIVALLQDAGFDAAADANRGFDHGAWVPLRYIAPTADIPVLQVSLPQGIDAAAALKLGEALRPLREFGVLVIGSGSLTHNLYEFRQHIADPEYAQQFADWVDDAVARRDVDALVHYRERAPHAARAHPTEEHYLPLLVALGASDADEARTRIDGGMTYGVLSMDSFAFGLDADALADAA
jgi:4,5-DOPA dioxygenase extradiol